MREDNSLIYDVRASLRISTADFDGEIIDLIGAARADLIVAGVSAEAVYCNSALIKRAIITYVKAEFGFDNPDADKFRAAYKELRERLSLATEYNGGDSA